jgi:hypothetical protein
LKQRSHRAGSGLQGAAWLSCLDACGLSFPFHYNRYPIITFSLPGERSGLPGRHNPRRREPNRPVVPITPACYRRLMRPSRVQIRTPWQRIQLDSYT